MSFDSVFAAASGSNRPYPYQTRLAGEPWPDVLDVPTGMGKTAAVTLAWLYKRGWRQGQRSATVDPETPRRLVWCLPMRVLVEQSEENIRGWLRALGILGEAGDGKVSVHVLMGGSEDVRRPLWAGQPEEDAIIIGTQDMLLSRALMRGYGMSRYQWPVHFALLHNDCMWIYDEVQLMGAGLPTSTQLEAFRRSAELAPSHASRSLWVSATLHKDWLGTVDFKPHLSKLAVSGLQAEDRAEEPVQRRLKASKRLQRAQSSLASGTKSDIQNYIASLAAEIVGRHQAGSQTLIILNNVDRAQQLHAALGQRLADVPQLLLHARFRAKERRHIERQLREHPDAHGRVIIATQAIEAGVDISSRTLFTELAPWTSMVQRFGRCNRDGKHEHADVFWVDIAADADKLARPYDDAMLESSRDSLAELEDVGPAHLPKVDANRPLTQVLRRREFLELFNTDADLSGFDVDVSPYIRDSDKPPVQVFWRNIEKDKPDALDKPQRQEICPASIGQIKAHLDKTLRGDVRKAWRWDVLDRGWASVRAEQVRPGMTLLLDAEEGGYDANLGFVPAGKSSVDPVNETSNSNEADSNDGDPLTQIGCWVSLPRHLADVATDAAKLCQSLHIDPTLAAAVTEAGRWHDLGKVHEAFQNALARSGHEPDATPPWAKSNGRGRLHYFLETSSGVQARNHFRHELVSMLAWLEHGPRDAQHDLIAYLIAAHHGKVRMGLRALPDERGPKQRPDRLFARGVWDGDQLPALAFDGRAVPETTLHLDIMKLGRSEKHGASWTARTQALLKQHGPFRLAWLETLVRIADWRASRSEQLAGATIESDNQQHELDHDNPTVAGTDAGAATADSSPSAAAESGSQHGIRGRTGGPTDVGAGTRPPHAATRHLDTTLGILSYAELAPHLARRVEALQNAIGEGEFDEFDIDEALLLEFHQRICGELTPTFAGRWRSTDVVVGSHEPPPAFQVAQNMRAYVSDLNARIEALPAEPSFLWLETLAFAEGRLLSIHPFTDFNGRVTRIFLDLLTRRLNLPDIDPTPIQGAETERYLAALRAADKLDWHPLMEIWHERLEQGAAE